MKYQIEVKRLWRASRYRFYTPGTYRVPEDMPDHHAKAAMLIKAGVRVSRKAAAAPENKAQSAAPENKEKAFAASSGR